MKSLVLAILCLVPLSGAIAEQRQPWTSSKFIGTPDPPKDYDVRRIYPKLQFTNPVEIAPLGNTGRMAVLEVSGRLLTFEDVPGVDQADLALELKPRTEQFRSAFTFACHPNFDQNRQVFIVYSQNPIARPNGARLSRFTMSRTNPPIIDPETEEVLLTWASGGHTGSAIRFDPNGLLYFSAGDGARPYPPDEFDTSQDLSDIRSSICRIDVDRPSGDRLYSIPDDNPFVNTPGARPEIWAYGFRNPWRYTFVPGTDSILCGDVGWELWEMVFDVRRGGNYGWSLFEGPQPIRSDVTPGPTPIQKPIVSYPHTVGQSITGGVVCQSPELPELEGVYLYGDYVTGLLWGLKPHEPEVTWNPVLAETGFPIITFGESRSGEVLVVSYEGGIYQLVRNEAAGSPSSFPRRLSETGLFESTADLRPSPGVYPYQPTTRSWQDGATSEFVIAIPGTGSIQLAPKKRAWKFPPGTVFANTLSVENHDGNPQRVETQVLHFDGLMWHPYSYLWNDEQTDAHLVAAEGTTKLLNTSDGREREWKVYHRAQCQTCHTRQRGGGIGFDLENLWQDEPGGRTQLDRFVDLGLFDQPIPKGWKLKAMVDPYDERESLEARARSYLSANCVHCHQRGGGGTVPLDLVYANATNKINAIDFAPTQGDFGIRNAKVIAPGNPSKSVMFYRMATSGVGHMPKLWSRDNDLQGLRLIHEWICSLDPDADRSCESDVEAALEEFASSAWAETAADELRGHAEQARSDGDAVRAALWERFLPAEQRKQRLGENINADAILALSGTASGGRSLVMENETFQCIGCHRVKGSGRSVGPDLDGIAAKRSKEQLLESILHPSKAIEPAYQTRVLLTVDGEVVSGLLIKETDTETVLRKADGKDVVIANDEIEQVKAEPQSLMPAGLAAQMTAQELADLLAFLTTLK